MVQALYSFLGGGGRRPVADSELDQRPEFMDPSRARNVLYVAWHMVWHVTSQQHLSTLVFLSSDLALLASLAAFAMHKALRWLHDWRRVKAERGLQECRSEESEDTGVPEMVTAPSEDEASEVPAEKWAEDVDLHKDARAKDEEESMEHLKETEDTDTDTREEMTGEASGESELDEPLDLKPKKELMAVEDMKEVEEVGSQEILDFLERVDVQHHRTFTERMAFVEDANVHGHVKLTTPEESTTKLKKEPSDNQVHAADTSKQEEDSVTIPDALDEEKADEVSDEASFLEEEGLETVVVKRKRVRVRRLVQDGNSLFSAIACGLYNVRPGTAEHRKHTKLMRKSAVKFLQDNRETYLKQLTDGVRDHPSRYEGYLTMDEKIDHYLKDLLEPGFPGGSAVLNAIADYYGINVVVVGKFSLITIWSDKENVTKEVPVLRMRTTNEFGEFIYHFDSVVDMEILELP